MKFKLLLLFFVASFCGFSQDYFPTNNGVKTTQTHYQAIINVTLHPSPNKTIENGTLLFKEGKIVTMGLPNSALETQYGKIFKTINALSF